ncbi:tripartite tricarboxylate transporter substrate binding protein [Achromobacter sp. GG226]|uniref:Bug family tripartite tricarboxylate transporter substrate binding protein n=1 Tax=Verticiella alkaliphila TaxID=2779529 RepID=UPI001C0D773D|nr:tripartite tricarboxylate transporter substrate binding protein [Verticiella sp. GG226]MBU4609448.1 tripartite tricarboxylate transporter substrate binding protein [Verticiella sp. GG226]
MSITKRLTALALSAVIIAPAVQAADFPTKPITIIVPYSAGGATDAAFRQLAMAAEPHFGRQVIVENRPGGSGAVAIAAMLQQTDGHTVSVIVPVVQRASYINQFGFDVVKDVTPIIQAIGLQYGIVVRADSPFKTVKDMVDYAKANPRKLNFVSAGIGSGGHVYMEELAAASGASFEHIPTKGDADAAAALMGNQVDVLAATPGGWSSLVQSGRLRLLATLGKERSKQYPDVPTLIEQGYDVFHLTPLGLGGPTNLDPEKVKVLHEGFRKALAEPAFVKAMEDRENAILYLGTADYTKAWAESYVTEGERVKYMK